MKFKKSMVQLSILIILSSVSSGCNFIGKSPLAPPPPHENKGIRPNPQTPGTNPLEILQLKQVQQELQLTSEQINQLTQISSKSRPPQPNSKGIPNQDARKPRDEGRNILPQILNSDQMNRFKEITLQIYGWSVIPQEEFSQVLSLSVEQNQQIDQVRRSRNEQLKTAFQPPPNPNPENCAQNLTANFMKMQEINELTNQEITTILTAEQKQTLNNLQGDKFNFNSSQLSDLCS